MGGKVLRNRQHTADTVFEVNITDNFGSIHFYVTIRWFELDSKNRAAHIDYSVILQPGRGPLVEIYGQQIHKLDSWESDAIYDSNYIKEICRVY
jgi:hypothetical protein